MYYEPDYGTALRQAANALVDELPSTLEGWGLLILAVIGLLFACTVMMVVADELLKYCALKRAQHESLDEVVE